MQRCLHIGAALGAVLAFAAALSACTSPPPGATPAADLTSRADSCINPQQIKKQTVLSDQDIQFEMNNGDVWVNHMDHRCPGLSTERGFAWDLHQGNSVCSNLQIIHVLNDGGTCSLGEFKRQPKAT